MSTKSPTLGTGPEDIPVFLWDRTLTTAQVRAIFGSPDHPRRDILLAALLREERPGLVWEWVTPQAVADALPRLGFRLGRQRAFWVWLIDAWRGLGLVE